MSKINDYLTKQLFIEKNVVTYRILSRALNIHVNEAKNELATFFASPRPPPEQPYATYIISGEKHAPARSQKNTDTQESAPSEADKMDVDSQEPVEEEEAGGEAVHQTTMVLVGQNELETTRTQFSRIYSEHLYSLSPSPLHDGGLICSSSSHVYEADTKISAEASTLLGRIVGSIHVGKIIPSTVASSSKVKAEPARKPGLKKEEKTATPEPKLKRKDTSEPVKKEVKEEDVPTESEKLAQASGKLDWSKAKAKGTKVTKTGKSAEVDKAKEEAMDTDIAEETQKKLSVAKGKAVEKSGSKSLETEQLKRGTKRKSALQMDSDSDSEPKPSPPVKAPIRPTRGTKRKSGVESDADSGVESTRRRSPAIPVKGKGKKVIISDDEEEEEALIKPKGKGKQATKAPLKKEEVPQSLKAMFDIEDDQIIQGSVPSADKPSSTEAESQPGDEDVEMAVDSDVPVTKKAPQKKRKEKKVIPVGSNGLKKKRVVKQKMHEDEAGYMVTEDYSSYESVDEEEPEPPKARKGAKAKKETSEDTKSAKASLKEPRKAATTKSSDSSTAKKSSGSKLSGKGSIQNFFNKK
ncbi:hypothetical protein EUX98_g584 [Antrodiella citrinella]|uniref:DNA polymerase delta subunit 3 n=1 Tax=Antrodiella citrinella TaxID=2447956 RepID=A0A4S4NCE6_9APHY|nr:hypothetical protein EUX98_g584 [Antrodiella citrinella]